MTVESENEDLGERKASWDLEMSSDGKQAGGRKPSAKVALIRRINISFGCFWVGRERYRDVN